MRPVLNLAAIAAFSFVCVTNLRGQTALFPGFVKVEIYTNITGTSLSDLTSHPSFPANPAGVQFVRWLEFPAGGPDGSPPPADWMDDYGVRISGQITPKQDGNYIFYLAARNQADFYLSPDENPGRAQLLAFEPVGSPVRAFLDAAPRPGCGTGACENISLPVSLAANRRYYFEARMKAGKGGENLAVALALEGQPLETIAVLDAAGNPITTQPPIRSDWLGVIADASVIILEQPTNTTVRLGGTAVFSVKVNQTPATYQWFKDGQPINGATNRIYETGPVAAGDSGGKFSVRVSNPLTAVTSAEAILTATAGPRITEQPAAATVQENSLASFAVVVAEAQGAAFQWQVALAGGAFENIPNATNRVLTLGAVLADDQKLFRVVISKDGLSATSNSARLTVTPDLEPPAILAVSSFFDGGAVVYFNEPVGPGASTAANYNLSGGITVTNATLLAPSTVFLETSTPLDPAIGYILIVGDVRDLAANGNVVSPNIVNFTSAGSAPASFASGVAKYERWTGLTPSTFEELSARIAAGAAPAVIEPHPAFEAPPNAADHYGARLTGWFVPPADGEYEFALATDGPGRLLLGAGSDPSDRKLIAVQTDPGGVLDWSGTPQKRSGTFAETEWPTGHRISLRGGKPYYLELVWIDDTGDDHAAATFWRAGAPLPAPGTASALRGDLIRGAVPCVECPPPFLEIQRNTDGSVAISYSGVLESSQTVTGGYTVVPGAASPHRIVPGAGQARFFRATR